MSTELLEHLGNIEVKDWDIYHHNIGLKPTPKYKTGFVIKTANNRVEVYNSDGVLMSTLVGTKSNIIDVLPVPSKGLMITVSNDTSGDYAFDIFDAKTGVKHNTISVSTMKSGSVYGCSYDVFENGDIAILNHANQTLYLYDKDGILKTSLQNAGNHKLAVCSTKKVIYVGNSSNHTAKILNADLSIRMNVPFEQYFIGFLEDGSLVSSSTSTTGSIRKTLIDYENNQVLSTINSPNLTPNTNYYVYFLRGIGKKIYLRRVYYSNYELLQLDEDLNVISQPTSFHVQDLDDKYLYSYNGTAYNVYSRNDLSLLVTVPSSYSSKWIRSTKGDYENFKRYW
jgi:hypothetical protein